MASLGLGLSISCCMAVPAIATDTHDQVPVVVVQDIKHFREMLLSSSSQIVRIGVFGDSQEASPELWGRHYMMQASALLVEAFGPASETVVYTQEWWDGQPNWLAATRSYERLPAVPTEIDPHELAPRMIPKARMGPEDGQDAFVAVLMPNAERCPVEQLVGRPMFLDGPHVVADILVSRRSQAGTLRWNASIVPGTEPWVAAPVLESGLVGGQPEPGQPAGWQTTGTLPAPVQGWRQVSVSGVDLVHPVDMVGLRFRNADQSRGVVLQPLAIGGMKLADLRANHSQCGPFVRALGLRGAILHYGANDTAVDAETWRSDLLHAIALLRMAHQDPGFPVIVITDPPRRNLPTGSAYGLLPGIAAEIAMSDSRVMALNMRRVHEERFLWSDQINYGLADEVHLRPHAQRMIAHALVGTLLESVGIPVPGCADGQSWSDRYYPLGASCAYAWPCTRLVREDALAAGRPFVAGADCTDADSDGDADICIDSISPDLNDDGMVDGSDLGMLFTRWNTDDPVADITRDGHVDGADLGLMLLLWGPLP